MSFRPLLLSVLAALALLLPTVSVAHWYYGCKQDWCSFGSPNYQTMNQNLLWPGSPCGSNMYMGRDSHCHFSNVTGYGGWYQDYYVAGSPFSASLTAPDNGYTYPAFSGSCGPFGYSFDHSCVCRLGYAYQYGSCVFYGCPSGYQYNQESSTCKPNFYNIGQQTACTTHSPCTCPSGYTPMANRVCIRAN